MHPASEGTGIIQQHKDNLRLRLFPSRLYCRFRNRTESTITVRGLYRRSGNEGLLLLTLPQRLLHHYVTICHADWQAIFTLHANPQ